MRHKNSKTAEQQEVALLSCSSVTTVIRPLDKKPRNKQGARSHPEYHKKLRSLTQFIPTKFIAS
jgi:hypothetical protein